MITLSVRLFAYICLAALVAQLSLFEVRSYGAEGAFSEFGMVQLGQSILLASGLTMAILAGRSGAKPDVLASCISLCFAMLLLRENDQIFELWLPHGFWKWPVLALFLWLVTVLWRHWAMLTRQLRAFSDTLSFGILLAGLTILVFSRLFGSSGFWETLMAERYWRPAKNAAEEGTELLAIALLAAGAVEFFLHRKRQNRGVS